MSGAVGAAQPQGDVNAPAERPGYWDTDMSANDQAPPPAKTAEKSGWIWDTIGNPALTGFEKARQVGALLASPVRSTENTAASIAAAQKATPPEPQFLQEADKVFAQSHGFFGVLDAYLTNPRALLAKGIQTMVQGGGVMLAGAGGGAAATSETGPGATLGAVAGAAGAGYLDTYGETVLQTLAAHGIDLSDKQAVNDAFNDPALMSEASVAAHKAGVPSAIINGLSFGVAGRVAGPVAARVGGGLTGAAAGGAAEVGAQAAIGGGGEAGTELAQGQDLNPRAIAEAAGAQGATVAPFMAHGVLRGGDPLAQTVRGVVEAPHTIMDHAQEAAAADAAAKNGDALSQVAAAAQANAGVGAVHDAALAAVDRVLGRD